MNLSCISMGNAKNNTTAPTTLSEVHRRIVSDELADQIAVIRAGDKHAANDLKKCLPGFLAAGIFSKRNRDSWESASGLMILDFDDVAHPAGLRCVLSGESCVVMAFVSPSGKGCKAVIRVPVTEPDEALHKRCFAAAERWADSFGAVLDPSGKDPARLCFFSCDPEAFLNLDAVPLDLAGWASPITISAPIAARSTVRDQPTEALHRRVMAYLNRLPQSIQGSNGTAPMLAAVRAIRCGFMLEGESFWDVARAWNEASAVPPWTEDELSRALKSVEGTPSRRPDGWLRDAPLRSSIGGAA